MELVTFVPMIACLYVIYNKGTRDAFISVVLPTLLLVPTYFFFVLRPLPSINFINGVLIVFGIALAFYDLPRWKFSRVDILVLAFVFTAGYTPLQLGQTTDALFDWFDAIVTGLVPYMAGKLLIEQTGSRIKVCRTFIVMVVGGSVLSSYEYFLKKNPYILILGHFYPTEWANWFTQVRWGFGRMAGPYSQSELAGQMIFTAWLLALWLARANYQEDAMRRPPTLPFKHGKAMIWGTFVALFMTQARGPWIGALLGLAVAAIGRAKRPGLRAVVVIGLFIGVGVPAYMLGKDYLAGPRKNYGSEKETAQYRAELVSNYIPLAEKSGLWGYGMHFHRIGGQDSIDNYYLLTWLAQGSVGVIALMLLFVESIGKLVFHSVRARSVRDLHFYMTLTGIFVGIAFTISTVFLGAQTYELLFLLVGWTQAIQTPRQA